ncbi:zinc finger protein 142 isoform X2 [Denticeps clupeoides]|nr:zinc finger protein 142 isoform X2 [Denticeps clupeoides]
MGVQKAEKTPRAQNSDVVSQKKDKQHTKKRKNPSKKQNCKDHVVEGTAHVFRTHICTECHRCFKTRSHLAEHMHLHFPDPSLQCPTCKHHFTSKSKLRVHMLRESGQKLHQCHLCKYSSVERNSLRRHLASVHGDEGVGEICSDEYPCPACGTRFRQSQALKAHMKLHHTAQNGEPMLCWENCCSFRTTDKKELQKHALNSHGLKAIECRHHACNAFFGSPEAMEVHHRTHQAFHCPQCDFSCSNKSQFQRHKKQGHPGEQELRCGFCSFTTFNPVEFDQHLGHFHANEKVHQCQQCDFVTAHKRVLSRHMLTHTGERPHKCKLCDFCCRDETYLSKHMLTHSDIKNHMCSECGYVTKWKHYLNVHMRKHAGDLRYQCNQCSYRCHRTDQLNSHKLRHQAKSLICEVCAYACKRKSELRKHMQLKHASGEEFQPPVFQCKYCSYQTRHRQALHNHENTKHTRNREFCCALCSYTTFSNTGLFLHKRKVHGYVPGDVQWLERYGQKEKEKNAVGQLHTFFSKPGPPEQEVTLQIHAETLDASGNHLQGPSHVEITDITVTALGEDDEQSVVDSEAAEPVSEKQNPPSETIQNVAIEESQSGSQHEPSCMLELTSISVGDCSHSSDKGEANEGSTCVLTGTDIAINCEERSESEDKSEPSVIPMSSSMDGSTAETPDAVLKAMRKQDKAQAEALVLEGRVEMLVVPTHGSVYRCDQCSYVTRKQASLREHCRSSCQVRKAALACKDCGAQFKQQRGLDTHRAKKCPAVLRKKQTFPLVPAAGKAMLDEVQEQDGDRSTQMMEVRISSETPLELRKDTSEKRFVTKQKKRTNNVKVKGDTHGISGDDLQVYKELDGKFTCMLCSFSSSRIATIERHCSSCSRHKPPCSNEGSSLPEEDYDVADHDQEEENSEAAAEMKIRTGLLSCPSCAFTCHQQRALLSHSKRGCLKPGEMQCHMCSFVAKSQKALANHAEVHCRDKPAADPRGRKPRLQCDLCAFTCKQARCMTQHVGLKHNGARPHQCRYCSFSTTRRYRLEAHESLHTGLGRHHCDLCGQSFGTTSKLRLHRQRVHDRRPTHFCLLCDYSGYSPNDISRHNLSCHTGELSHPCHQCEARFSSETALKQHCSRKHQAPSSASCTECNFTCNSGSTLRVHVQREHTQLRCALCQIDFGTQESLESHQKAHLTQQCPACPFATRKRLVLAQHLLDEHEEGPAAEKPLKCGVCDFSCRHQLVFEQHIRSHGGTRLYKCTECQYSTRNKQKITWHIRIHTGEKPYTCDKCSYSCADPSRLKYHMRIHRDERKYLCPDCGYKCKWVSQLKYHMTKHTGSKPYACEECEYRTNRPDALRVHRETRHRDVRSFICEKCGKAFKTRFLLKTHQRKHSEERPYQCGSCPRAFRWAAGLKHHYLSHTNQQPFRCLHCPYRAKQRFQVVKHLQRHHPDQPAEQGVAKDPGAPPLTLQRARLPLAEEGLEETVELQEDIVSRETKAAELGKG